MAVPGADWPLCPTPETPFIRLTRDGPCGSLGHEIVTFATSNHFVSSREKALRRTNPIFAAAGTG
jgi:hypothetical protein